MVMCIGLISLVVYFFPTIIAHDQNHPQFKSIFLVNLLLGWTFIGWVIALVWAYQKEYKESKKTFKYKDGEPCPHSGCLHHISHPCEGCGRIGGRNEH